jgi:sugar lactone lactonase YvrE
MSWLFAPCLTHSQTLRWTVIAGSIGGYGYADGTNASAKFYNQAGIALDDSGNLYIGDTVNHCIRKISRIGADWVTTTIAGRPASPGFADGTNSRAAFFQPQDLVLDPSGNIYVTDSRNNAIRKLTQIGTNWVVTTIAGSGVAGGQDGTNRHATFNYPNAITIDQSTNLYVCDFGGGALRKITPIGTNWVTTTLAGFSGSSGFADGTNSSARFNQPNGIAIDSHGTLFVADYGNFVIRQIAPVGTNWVVTSIAGTPGVQSYKDGTNNVAKFIDPLGILVDAADDLYVTDQYYARKLTHVDGDWIVTSLRGQQGTVFTERLISFNQANALALDRKTGELYVADSMNNCFWVGRPGFMIHSAVSGSQLLLSWPLGASNYLLQTTATPADPASWMPVGTPPSPTNGGYGVSLDMNAPAAFYRLQGTNP